MARFRVEYTGEEEVIQYEEFEDTLIVEAESAEEAEEIAERELRYVDGLNIYDVINEDEDDE